MSKLAPETPITNRLLAALSRAEAERLRPALAPTHLAKGAVLYDVADTVSSAYFIQSGVVSLLAATRAGETIEVAMVGPEGLVGIPSLLRRSVAPTKAVVKIAGIALTISGATLRAEFRRGGDLQDLVLCFTHTLVTQLAQAVLCNHYHSLEARLSRWFLADARPRTGRHVAADA